MVINRVLFMNVLYMHLLNFFCKVISIPIGTYKIDATSNTDSAALPLLYLNSTTMNFFDYELSRNATATPPQSASDANTSAEPTLNEEVNQVVGQLGKLWGGFRKQVRGRLHVRPEKQN